MGLLIAMCVRVKFVFNLDCSMEEEEESDDEGISGRSVIHLCSDSDYAERDRVDLTYSIVLG